ncbi:MAG: hypothetical protein HKN60_09420 [Rhizobiales bacterium]|nr:hypothetical protein [Hyphomicrobiales bacterium]
MSKASTAIPKFGTGLLAVFCDLALEYLDEFRPWLMQEMFPPRMAIGFGPAASFDLAPELIVDPPAGAATPQAHVTIYVTPTIGDLYGAPYQNLRAERGPRDAAYHNERMQNQARYVAALTGPGIESDEKNFAPVLLIDRFDVAPDKIQTFNIWFETAYVPACAQVLGVARLSRYLTMEGNSRHLLVHEIEGAQVLEDQTFGALRRAGEWDLCTFAPGAPGVYRKVAEAEAASRG